MIPVPFATRGTARDMLPARSPTDTRELPMARTPPRHADRRTEAPGRRRAAPARTGKAVTIRDVAKVAGVSPITVSRALSRPELVTPETLERVRAVVARTGYVPNVLAGSLRSRRSRIIAAVFPQITNTMFVDTIQALTDRLRRGGLPAPPGAFLLRDARGRAHRRHPRAQARRHLPHRHRARARDAPPPHRLAHSRRGGVGPDARRRSTCSSASRTRRRARRWRATSSPRGTADIGLVWGNDLRAGVRRQRLPVGARGARHPRGADEPAAPRPACSSADAKASRNCSARARA